MPNDRPSGDRAQQGGSSGQRSTRTSCQRRVRLSQPAPAAFHGLGADDVADDLPDRLRDVTGLQVSARSSPAVPCQSLTRDWDRSRAELIDPYSRTASYRRDVPASGDKPTSPSILLRPHPRPAQLWRRGSRQATKPRPEARRPRSRGIRLLPRPARTGVSAGLSGDSARRLAWKGVAAPDSVVSRPACIGIVLGRGRRSTSSGI